MHHDRQGCLSKEIIPQPRVRFLLVKFLQVSQKVVRHSSSLMPSSSRVVSTSFDTWSNKFRHCALDQMHAMSALDVLGPISLSPSLPDTLQTFCFYKRYDVPKFLNKSSHCIGSMVGEAHSCSSL